MALMNSWRRFRQLRKGHRRAGFVRDVVKGQRLQTVSDTLHFTYSALRKWVYRFAHQGVHGLVDRPRSGRPPKVTCALEQHLQRLVEKRRRADFIIPTGLNRRQSVRAIARIIDRVRGRPGISWPQAWSD